MAIEVHYHKTCHLNYCRTLTRKLEGDNPDFKPIDELYKASYNAFCSAIITDKLLKQKKIMHMRQLHSIFVKQVKVTENIDASGYRVFRLKARLQRDFPELVFHRPQMRNQSEFVFVEEICVGDVVDSGEYVHASSESEKNSDDCGMEIGFERETEANLSELYNIAIVIRKAMKEVQNIKLPWPPNSKC